MRQQKKQNKLSSGRWVEKTREQEISLTPSTKTRWIEKTREQVLKVTHYVDPVSRDHMQATEYVCGCIRDDDLDDGFTIWHYCKNGKLCVRKSRAEDVADFLGYGYSKRSEGFVW